MKVGSRDLCWWLLSLMFLGRDETMQPAKPSFLEYFEQKEKEANSQNEGQDQGHEADNRKLPAEGDMEVVSHVMAW